jgi:hypothetical protein
VANFANNQFLKYTDTFNLFHAKPINLIVSEKHLDFVVVFKDHEFFIEELEYLKGTIYVLRLSFESRNL